MNSPEQARELTPTPVPPVAQAVVPAPRRVAPELWLAAQAADAGILSGARQAGWLRQAGRFTSRLCIEPPDALLLELAGSRKLFGGARPLLAQVRAAFPAPWRLAAAPTPLAALALARAGRSVCITSPSRLRSRLAALPLSVLRWPEELLSRLDSMGAGCIGDLQRLPRAGLARRIGAERVRELDRLVTPGMDPRPPVAPPVQFSRRVDLDFETFDSGRVLSALRPVLEQLEDFLRARQRGITALRVALVHRSGPPTCCMVRCVAPEYGASRLAALLAARMECLLLAQPVRSAWLVAGRLRGFSSGSGTLWQPGEHGGQAAERMPEFLQTLQARLGEQAVYGVSCVVGHRPEYQWRRTAPGLAVPEVVQPEPPRACQWPPAARPLGLLEPPVALTAERDGRGHVCALWHEGSRLELMSGPERIESGWWDGADIARDYYTARTPVGALLWVFRERHGMRRWFLHGCFA